MDLYNDWRESKAMKIAKKSKNVRPSEMNIAVVMDFFKIFGGSDSCAYSVIEALNGRGIIPDVYVVNPFGEEKNMKKLIREIFNKDLKFNFYTSIGDRLNNFISNRIDREYFFALHFLLSSLFGKRYHFIYDFTLFRIPIYTNKGNYLSYPHYLYDDAFKIRYKGSLKLKSLIHWLRIKKRKYNFYHDKVKVVMNSKYTADCVKKYFNKSVDYIYPPVNITKFKNSNEIRKKQVITVGVFRTAKKQLEQVDIARYFPDIKFYICGSKSDTDYFKKLKEEASKTKNVSICPSINQNLLVKLLQESLFFLHSMRGEHFGIAIAEAIAAGCIPVVHNSGGPREIVSVEELRWTTKEEAIKILDKLLKNPKVCQNYRKKLKSHIEQFDEKVFQENILRFANL